MDKNFLIAYKDTVANEGALSSDTLGGLTWKGIARKQHPEWSGWEIIDKYIKAKTPVALILKDAGLEILVKDFYNTAFWLHLQLNKIKDVRVSKKIFDTAVNMGESAAIKFAEISVGIQKVDGRVDDELIKKLNAIV